MSLTERPLRLSDAAAITATLQELERAEPADDAWSEDEIAEDMTGQGIDLNRGSVGVFDGAAMVAFGNLEVVVSDEAWQAYLFGGVHPDWARRGLGTRVVSLLADQAKVWRDADRPDLPGELKLWVPEQRRGATALAAAQGFETWRWFVRMRCDLTGPLPERREVDGYLIRPFTRADSDATRLAYNASFADHWGSSPRDAQRWSEDILDATAFRPQHSYLALEAGGAVAGFVIVDEFDGETELRGYRTGYVHLVGTVRAARGRGIASALLTHSLAGMAEDGYRVSELGVDADSPTEAGRVYQRLGYRPVDRSQVFGRRF